MGEKFEQYKARIEKAYSDEMRASKEANDRFDELSDYLSRFNQKDVRGIGFQWHCSGWLELHDKCVGLAPSSKGGWRKVWFGETPSNPNQLDQSPRRIQEWSLRPVVEEDEFKWKIAERRGATFTNDELADEAAIHLTNLAIGRYGQYPEPTGGIHYAVLHPVENEGHQGSSLRDMEAGSED
jgi:hypothetical protein